MILVLISVLSDKFCLWGKRDDWLLPLLPEMAPGNHPFRYTCCVVLSIVLYLLAALCYIVLYCYTSYYIVCCAINGALPSSVPHFRPFFTLLPLPLYSIHPISEIKPAKIREGWKLKTKSLGETTF